MITITGGDGFIGKHVQELLPNSTIIDLKRNRDILDMTDDDTGNTIIHLAAVSSIPESFTHPEKTMRANMEGLAHVIWLCQMNGTKLIFASSSSVRDPRSLYAYSKLWGEQMIELSGINYCILRLGNVYGEGDDKSAVHKFKEADIITIHGDETHVRSFVYVKDVAQAFVDAIDKEGTFNIATERMNINELAKLFNKPMQYDKERQGDAPYLYMQSNYHGGTKLKDWLAQ